jgi:hypothetical protein
MMGTPALDPGKEDAVAIASKNRMIAMKRHLEMAPEHNPLDTSASIRFAAGALPTLYRDLTLKAIRSDLGSWYIAQTPARCNG